MASIRLASSSICEHIQHDASLSPRRDRGPLQWHFNWPIPTLRERACTFWFQAATGNTRKSTSQTSLLELFFYWQELYEVLRGNKVKASKEYCVKCMDKWVAVITTFQTTSTIAAAATGISPASHSPTQFCLLQSCCHPPVYHSIGILCPCRRTVPQDEPWWLLCCHH